MLSKRSLKRDEGKDIMADYDMGMMPLPGGILTYGLGLAIGG